MRKLLSLAGCIVLLVTCYLSFPPPALAQIYSPTVNANEEIVTARVRAIVKKDEVRFDNRPYIVQTLTVEILEGKQKGQMVTVTTSYIPVYRSKGYPPGQTVLLGHIGETADETSYYIIDYYRLPTLVFLSVVFLVLLLVVTGKRGVFALVGMVLSFAVIVLFLLPFIAKGYHPLGITLLSIAGIVPLTFYITHGINKKTHIALAATALSLCITGLLAKFVLDSATITGTTIEELDLLLQLKTHLHLASFLLAGMLIALLGVLDDITITQASLVAQLHTTKPKSTGKQLFTKAMQVGHDHISSVVNTLILVYAGSSLPLFLLLTEYPRPWTVMLNSELISLQIITALLTTIGLILAIPITTGIASVWYTRKSV